MTLSAADIRQLVEAKRSGRALERAEIEGLVRGFTRGEIDDEHMTGWLKAVCLKGMSLEETADLTRAMAESGETIDWSDVAGPVVDKHSTGGVGDAVTLVAVPVAAACGVKVAKLSGRALGHTGGTIDKLECIPNMRTELSVEKFKAQVASVGCAIAAATAQLAPADKKMYALRDRTDTVASVPLIAASVLSKKIAGGAPAIVLDVKVGDGAFMRTLDEGRELARVMVEVGRRLGRRVRVLLTAMDEPLADSVGDALELDEALRVLEGSAHNALRDVALAVAAAMLETADEGPADDAARRAAQALDDGSALRSFSAMVEAQGGRLDDFDRRFAPTAAVPAPADGIVGRIDALAIGQAVARAKAAVGENESRRVGIRLRVRAGDHAERGQMLAELFGCGADRQAIERAITVGNAAPTSRPLVLGEVA